MPNLPSPSRAAKMRDLLARHGRGEATLRELAAEGGVSVSTLTNWRRRLRTESQPLTDSRASFVEVRLDSEPASRPPSLFVEIAGHRVEVPSGFDPEHLSGLLSVLRGC